MTVMLPDPLFWYGLALKVTMTATIVVVASVAAERSGPFLAALIAALPTAASATYIILALEHPPAFLATSAIGSMAANPAVAIFAVSYSALAQRHGIVLSMAAASLVWFAAVALLRLVDWTPATALVLNAVVFAFTIPLSARYRTGAVARESFRRSSYDLPVRAAAVAVVVGAVTTASHWIGPFASGTFAVFPIVMGSFAVIMHSRGGGKAAAAVFAHAQPALMGLCLGFLGVHYLVEPIGVWWSLAAGLAITGMWSAALWLGAARAAAPRVI
jgi:uncharacterized membrane protein (GlpM family)